MKKLQLLFISLLISIVSVAQLEPFLKSQPIIKSIEKITSNDFFNETWKIMVQQPIDHSDTTKGFFLQRVFVADKGKENAVLLITEGYEANYAASPRYINELSPMLQSNQICVEHRYFEQSCPDSLNWDYLTVANAAADHHTVVELFKNYYSGKWINTGISKGGQTAVYHRTYYPEDVDVTVAYVCPLNFAVEDKRHEKFIQNIPGTKEEREKIRQFQVQVLKNRDKILPKLGEYSKQKKFEYYVSIDEVLDYCVLEFPFALWQWGISPDKIPLKSAEVDELFNFLMEVPGPKYFAKSGIEGFLPFYVQAARELGYYAYDSKPFKEYLKIESAKNYFAKLYLPGDVHIEYIKETALRVKKFIQTTNEEMIFIYGEFDPWTASAFEVPHKPNLLKIVKPGGSHSARIGNLPPEQKKQVIDKLEDWLGISIATK